MGTFAEPTNSHRKYIDLADRQRERARINLCAHIAEFTPMNEQEVRLQKKVLAFTQTPYSE